MINCAFFSFTTTGDDRVCISVSSIMSIYFNHASQSMEVLYNNANADNAIFHFTTQKYFDDAYDTWNDISYTIGKMHAPLTAFAVDQGEYPSTTP